MNDAEQPSPNDTPENSSGSNGSLNGTDLSVPSPVQPPAISTPTKSATTKPRSLPVLRTKGGNLAEIANTLAEDLVPGLPAKTKDATLAFIHQNAHGFVGAMAMKCQGKRCPIISVCPLAETNQALPTGKPCPFEMAVIQMWVNKHLLALGIEDFSLPENSFDMDILYELAAHELIKWKAAHHIASTGRIIQERQVSATVQGDAIFAEVISPALEVLDIHNKITAKLRDALLATRKAQIQAGRDMGDPSKKAATLAASARKKAMERLGRGGEDVQDADFEVKDE